MITSYKIHMFTKIVIVPYHKHDPCPWQVDLWSLGIILFEFVCGAPVDPGF
jgi:serine/threonine protein kinase